jgi:hypothetical protein
VTVIKAGFFPTSSSGNTINYLRIDMSVSLYTLGAGHYFQLFNLTVSSPHAQYQFDPADSTCTAAGRSFNSGDEATGYWIFQVQGTLDPLAYLQLSFWGGYASDTPWVFQL